jgi:hypothetical protein
LDNSTDDTLTRGTRNPPLPRNSMWHTLLWIGYAANVQLQQSPQ